MNLVRAPKTPKGNRTRERILAEARHVIVEQGFDALAMRDLAKRCDVQLGNLQYYFATRDSVAMAVIAAEAEADISEVRVAMETHDDPDAQLAAVVRSFFVRWRGESGLIFATLIYLCMHKPEFLELKKRIYRAFYESLESLIRSLDTEVTPVELRQRVALITAIMDGSVAQSTGGSRTFVDAVVATVTGVAHGRSGPGL